MPSFFRARKAAKKVGGVSFVSPRLMKQSLEKTSRLPISPQQLRDWHLMPGAFARLQPPWERAEIVEAPEAGLVDGAIVKLAVAQGPVSLPWVAEHHFTTDGFVDRQLKGPFSFWEHHHRFLSDPDQEDDHSVLTDSIRYTLPLGKLGQLVAGPMIRTKLRRMFTYRHNIMNADMNHRQKVLGEFGKRSRWNSPCNILITGVTGMVGSAMKSYFETQGHTVYGVTRTPSASHEIAWDLDKMTIDLPDGVHFDAVIHLAGSNIAEGRWTEERKQEILSSREKGTRLIAETFANLDEKPSVILCASGANAYEASPESPHTEDSPAGSGFLPKVVAVWEQAADPAREAGIRVVHARLGVVLSPAGGALKKLLPLFQLGGGGKVGSGQQHMPWIALDDVIYAFDWMLRDEDLEGPVNLVSPQLTRNDQFTEALGSLLQRPTVVPAPAFALKLAFGEMAEETILADMPVIPGKLQEAEFDFTYPDIDEALKHLLGRSEEAESKEAA